MDEPTRGKLFDQLINAVSSRDEKQALEEAKKHLLDLERRVAEMQTQLESQQNSLYKTQAELNAANQKASAAEQRAAKAEMDLKATNEKLFAAESKLKQYSDREALVQGQAAAAEAAKAKILATHKISANETLSHLALQYYGHATEPYWRLIYEANKEAIGANPNKVRVGTLLEIPVLPDSMK